MDDHSHDPLASRFDTLLAMTAYGLLFFSVFSFWITAVVAAAIAFTHRRGADWRTASHFRFQLKIFWWSIALVALAVTALTLGGGFALGALWAAATHTATMPAGATAGLLTLGAIVLYSLSSAWTIAASLWGAYRLATGRAIGQSAAGRALEPR